MKKKLYLSALLCAVALVSSAQKIDFDMTGRQTKEVTEPGYESWQIGISLSETKTFVAEDGSEVEITVDCGDGEAKNHRLRSNWNKNIVQKNTQLAGDAVVVYGYDGGNTPHLTSESAEMNVSIAGLKPGEHSMLAYLNVTDGNRTTIAPVDVLVNGSTVQTGVIMSNQVLKASDATTAYVKFNVAEGETVKVSFVSRPEAGQTYSTSGIYLNALVLDRPNPKTTALDPSPANLDMHVDADDGSIKLAWTQATSAVKNIVYIGTSEADMQLLAETDVPEYTATNLSTHNVYYWRVDQRDASGEVYKGDTWTFRPRRLAFPGAEGYGRYAIGGRGGSVYHVTSLEDDPQDPQPGTFRYGITQVKGPRTIVFDIAGTIYLKARLTCSDPYVTIAGQTAPGKGILFRGSPIGMANDGITRFVRMRRGFHNDDEADMNRGLDGLGMAGNNHSIMDHCSVGWTIDEAFSSRNAKNMTLQRTLISEALNQANHPNYGSGKTHGFAATIGGDIGSYHHNLLAHNEGRNWSLGGGLDGNGAAAGRNDIFNNVVYNWGGRATDGGTHECNFVGNYYKKGPSTNSEYILNAQLENIGTGTQSYYVKGNIREEKDGRQTEDKLDVTYKASIYSGKVVDWEVFVDKPFFESLATVESARLAFKTVLSDVGANQPFFDEHDVRMVDETLNGTYTYSGSKTGKKGLVDRETDSEGYGYFYTVGETREADYDTDQDGMPDWWEKVRGSNPAAADNNDYSSPFGYTALEEYLNWIAEPNYRINAGVETAVADLGTLFAGFKNPSYNIIGVPSGYDIMENGGKLMVTAPVGVNELITVKVLADSNDGVGSMTRNINLCVTSDGTGMENIANIGNDPDTSYRIYNINGIQVADSNDVSSLASGVYILKAINGKQIRTVKIIKR